MPDSATKTHAPCRCARIRELNDQLRTTHVGGRVVMTRAVSQLGQRTLLAMFVLLRNFTAFDADNDPHGAHDMGALEIGPTTVLWKIECYDRAVEYASPDPAEAEVTARILTLMLAEEY